MALDFVAKHRYDVNDLIKIVALLRGEGGCPWDKEQTHDSIRSNFLEEVYEVLDAIDRADTPALREELGDVLLQVVFHAQMAKEDNEFSFDDVANEICKKLVLRHPHVFGDVTADTTQQVLNNWDAIKQKEKGQETYTDTLKSVPKVFPALMRAHKVQKRAAKAGFDWDDVGEPLLKVSEETAELEEAVEDGCPMRVMEEFGDLLFAMVNVSRFIGVDPEQALASATDKFIRRFSQMEQLATEQGASFKDMSLEEMDALWDAVKEKEVI